MIIPLIVMSLLYQLLKEKINQILDGLDSMFKKKRFIKIFLDELNKKMKNYKHKKTELIFNFEIFNEKNVLYNKLIIFGKSYSIEPNKSLKITINKDDLIKSDFTDNITLSNSNSNKSFLITINLRQENYYQTFLDILNNTNATEIVFYSKDNIPESLSSKHLKLKTFDTNEIPRIKRFYAINIDVNEVKSLYNHYASNKMENNKIIKTDIFINLIKNNNKIIGRIFEQTDEKVIEDFNPDELKFLKEFEQEILKQQLFPFIQSSNNEVDPAKEMDVKQCFDKFLSKNNNNSIKFHIQKKMSNICFFLKYFYNEPTNEDFKIIERIIFLNLLNDRNIIKAYKYINKKKEIFNKPFEFTLKEKIFLSLNIALNLNKDIYDAKLFKLYSLPETSPYLQSELFYRDIVLNLGYESSLYFFFLQLNSTWGIDIISSDSWFKIKKIHLYDIQYHLLSDFSPFFFVYNSLSKVAFCNPQTLIKAYNENEEIGYFYLGKFAKIKSINNTIKLSFVKIHEESHCKYKGGFNMKHSGRYLLNNDLNVIDCHLDTILFDVARKNSFVGEEVGEEGYAAEIYITGNYKTIDRLLKSNGNLQSLYNIKLFTGPNFDDLKKEILSKISHEDIMMLEENYENSKDFERKRNNIEKENKKERKGLMEIFLDSLDNGLY